MAINESDLILLDWAKIKLIINSQKNGPNFDENQIWWVNLGHNIGREQNGKNKNFERPVLILKKFNQDTFWCLPISTKIKDGQYYFNFKRGENNHSINLSQLRLLSCKRLLRCVGNFNRADFESVKDQIRSII